MTAVSSSKGPLVANLSAWARRPRHWHMARGRGGWLRAQCAPELLVDTHHKQHSSGLLVAIKTKTRCKAVSRSSTGTCVAHHCDGFNGHEHNLNFKVSITDFVQKGRTLETPLPLFMQSLRHILSWRRHWPKRSKEKPKTRSRCAAFVPNTWRTAQKMFFTISHIWSERSGIKQRGWGNCAFACLLHLTSVETIIVIFTAAPHRRGHLCQATRRACQPFWGRIV